MTTGIIALLVGARPNYMKVFPIWKHLHDNPCGLTPVLIHSGQHYDAHLNTIFFEEFGMPEPDHCLGVGSGPHGAQTARTMIALEELFTQQRPDMLVVVGDVNSTLAGALVAVKMGIPVAHVEAGLRSRDRTMPEEINRLATDAICDLLLTPSPDADENLRAEGIPPERIHFVGNVMIDSLVMLLPRAQQSPILEQLDIEPKSYCLVTLHRPSNVDDPVRLRVILDQLATVAADMPVVFPVHPRTKHLLDQMGWTAPPGLRLLEPLGYLDFLCLESNAEVVVTDSGGVQEETTYLGIPCLTLRPNTERPITTTQGTNRLLNPNVEFLNRAADQARSDLRGDSAPALPLWDGQAAGRIVDVLQEFLS